MFDCSSRLLTGWAMRILGLDMGTRTIGLAISDPFGWTAQGLETYRRTGRLEDDLKAVVGLIKSFQVERVVVGLPRNMDGSRGPAAVMVEEFAERLTEKAGVPVVMWDERLTTVSAQRVLIEADVSRRKRKKVVDQMAAVLILQGYLNWLSKSASPKG